MNIVVCEKVRHGKCGKWSIKGSVTIILNMDERTTSAREWRRGSGEVQKFCFKVKSTGTATDRPDQKYKLNERVYQR